MSTLIAFFTFLISSGYVLFLDYLLLSPRTLQKVMVVPIVIILFALYRSARNNSWQLFAQSYNKWIFLFGGTIFIQLLVLSTDGIESPFLILIHLFMIGISFLFTFAISLLFLFFSFLIIFIDMSFYQNIITSFLTNPTGLSLRIISLLSIIPLAYIVSQQYHAKTILSSFLKKKVDQDQKIFSQLSDMVIITDSEYHILSVNDAAARTIQQTPAELLDKQLFDVLLLRDPQNRLVTKTTSFTEKSVFTLMRSPTLERKVTIYKQEPKQEKNMTSEITFVVSYLHHTQTSFEGALDKSRAKYEALMQKIKKQLSGKRLPSLQRDIMLMEKIENDTYSFQRLQQTSILHATSRIDIAQLAKQTLLANQEFAKLLGITTAFSLQNFGEKDLQPLTVKGYAVKPENLTGPFFTVTSYSNEMQLLMQKLIDLALFFSLPDRQGLHVSAQPGEQDTVVVQLIIATVSLQKDELWVPGYGSIAGKANLHLGSGLEGYLIKQLTDSLGITLSLQEEAEKMLITLTIPKKVA